MDSAQTAQVAYARYEGRGCVPGHQLADWFAAEQYLAAHQPNVAAAAQSARFDAFLHEFFASRYLLLSRYNVDATYDEIQSALQELYGVDREMDLSLKKLNAEKIAEDVSAFPLDRFRASVLESIVVTDIPIPNGSYLLFTEEIVKHKGQVWEIHQNDADPFPHPIHGHLKGTALKIDFRDGQIYEKRKFVSQMRKKHLDELRSRFRTTLPELII